MNIDKLKHQHLDIIGAKSALRTLAQAGVAQNAADIARLVVRMSSTIKLHLAVEDQVPYPAEADLLEDHYRPVSVIRIQAVIRRSGFVECQQGLPYVLATVARLLSGRQPRTVGFAFFVVPVHAYKICTIELISKNFWDVMRFYLTTTRGVIRRFVG